MNAIIETHAMPQPITVTDGSASVLDMILRAASDPSVSIEKMERLFALHEKMQKDKARKEYSEAMAAAQADIGPVARDRQNAHTKSAYATLEAIDEAIRPISTRHGFALSFDAQESDKGLTIICDVLHSGGHSERKTLTGALDTIGTNGTRNKTDIQGLGSTTSYLRRYLTCMVFNVAIKNEDKDGNKTAATLSAVQYLELKEKLDLIGGDEAKFVTPYRVETLADVPASKFDDAIARIERRAQQIAAERSNAA